MSPNFKISVNRGLLLHLSQPPLFSEHPLCSAQPLCCVHLLCLAQNGAACLIVYFYKQTRTVDAMVRRVQAITELWWTECVLKRWIGYQKILGVEARVRWESRCDAIRVDVIGNKESNICHWIRRCNHDTWVKSPQFSWFTTCLILKLFVTKEAIPNLNPFLLNLPCNPKQNGSNSSLYQHNIHHAITTNCTCTPNNISTSIHRDSSHAMFIALGNMGSNLAGAPRLDNRRSRPRSRSPKGVGTCCFTVSSCEGRAREAVALRTDDHTFNAN
jgi:hypothetical protein